MLLSYGVLVIMMASLFTANTAAQVSPAWPGGCRELVAAVARAVVISLVYSACCMLAMQVTAVRLISQVSSRADLVGKAVGTWTPYVPTLLKYQTAAVGLPWCAQRLLKRPAGG